MKNTVNPKLLVCNYFNMGMVRNSATYLNKTDKERLSRIAKICQVSESKVLRILFHYNSDEYMIGLTNAYKDLEYSEQELTA